LVSTGGAFGRDFGSGLGTGAFFANPKFVFFQKPRPKFSPGADVGVKAIWPQGNQIPKGLALSSSTRQCRLVRIATVLRYAACASVRRQVAFYKRRPCGAVFFCFWASPVRGHRMADHSLAPHADRFQPFRPGGPLTFERRIGTGEGAQEPGTVADVAGVLALPFAIHLMPSGLPTAYRFRVRIVLTAFSCKSVARLQAHPAAEGARRGKCSDPFCGGVGLCSRMKVLLPLSPMLCVMIIFCNRFSDRRRYRLFPGERA